MLINYSKTNGFDGFGHATKNSVACTKIHNDFISAELPA